MSELYLYDTIGETWGGGITAEWVARELAARAAEKEIDVRINSLGGDVFVGNTIYELLKNSGKNIRVHIDGVAASIASLIALAGSERIISKSGYFMIHNPTSLTWGEEKEHRKAADLLAKVKGTMLDVYQEQTGGERDMLARQMDDETWFTGQEALDAGFATAIAGDAVLAISEAPMAFGRMPDAIRRRLRSKAVEPPTKDPIKRKLAANWLKVFGPRS